MEKFILANGCALRISDTQNGEKTIVLIHGFFESMDIFDTLIKALKKTYRVIAIDVPGHGISEVMGECHTMEFIADTINEVLRQLGVVNCYIAGHSMGGYMAAKYAEKYTSQCNGLIMIHSIFDNDSEERVESRKKEIALIRAGKKELFARINPGKGFAAFNRIKYKEVISNLEDQALMTDEDGIIALQNGMILRHDLNDFATTTTIPILSIWGTYDEFFPLDYAKEFIKQHPQIKSVIMEQSGHMSFIEEQDNFVEIINEFIN